MIRLRPRAAPRRAAPRPDEIVVGLLILAGVLVVGAALLVSAQPGQNGGGWSFSSAASPAGATAPATRQPTYLVATPRQAPRVELVDPDAAPFALASLRGHQVLVFFGYTHCPDVCPATIGVVGQVLAAEGPGVRAVFVTVDPERDTTAWLREYSQYLPAGFVAVTGTDDQIRTTAAAWGVRYTRVETGSPGAYSMMHTADVFLVDAAGFLRADFPFGTGKDDIIRTIDAIKSAAPEATPNATASPTASPASPQPSQADGLEATVVSTSVWAGPQTPVMLALRDRNGRIDDAGLVVHVAVEGVDATDTGAGGQALPVRPPGVGDVSYVVTLRFPAPGPWQLRITASNATTTRTATAGVTALDPGTTAAIGAPAPTVHTPTLDDVGGNARAITTDPQPDVRLSIHSTTDALAAHRPFVLVIDSPKFRVSPVCGKAVIMARYLADRWPDVDFIHLEPFVYTLVSDTPVLSGDLADPPVAPAASAWGIDGAPWGGRSMPWVFVVDANGIVRAKYQGLMGSDDIDVLLAELAGGA